MDRISRLDRASKTATIVVRILLLLYIISAGILCILSYQSDIKLAEEYYRENGGQTTATVIEARNYKKKIKSNRGAHAPISYKENYSDFTIEYTIDGEEYVSNFYDYRGTFKKGEILTVYYLNSDPVEGIEINRKPPLKAIKIGISAVAIIVVLLLIDTFRAIHKLRTSEKKQR